MSVEMTAAAPKRSDRPERAADKLDVRMRTATPLLFDCVA
jgi:hypothetical protein